MSDVPNNPLPEEYTGLNKKINEYRKFLLGVKDDANKTGKNTHESHDLVVLDTVRKLNETTKQIKKLGSQLTDNSKHLHGTLKGPPAKTKDFARDEGFYIPKSKSKPKSKGKFRKKRKKMKTKKKKKR